LRSLASHPAARGLEDDAAVLEVGGEALVITHDMMAEGTHYLPNADMADVAWKLVAVNLSDLAAKGAEPLGVLLGHMLGEGDDRFLAGLREALHEFDVPLLGGDTIAGTGPRAFGLTAIGRATHSPVPDRRGAKPGDVIHLCGRIGEAMLGFEAMRDSTGADSAAYRRPRPLIEEGQALAPLAHAMMDVSDGLLLDAQRMAIASGSTFALDSTAIAAIAPPERLDDAMRWGDDYALLLAAAPDAALPVATRVIGQVMPRGDHPLLIDGIPPPVGAPLGYEHRNS